MVEGTSAKATRPVYSSHIVIPKEYLCEHTCVESDHNDISHISPL